MENIASEATTSVQENNEIFRVPSTVTSNCQTREISDHTSAENAKNSSELNSQDQSIPSSLKRAKLEELLSRSNYKVPENEAAFDSRYGLEVLKNGAVVETHEFKNADSFNVVGRLPVCDIIAEHPTISRLHAVLQFTTPFIHARKETDPETSDDAACSSGGLFLCDLNSTHGTFLNKHKIFPNRFYKVHVGHVLKFGSSTRLYIVTGPPEDEEPESDKSVTELMKERNEKLTVNLKMSNVGQEGDEDEDEGISWGMGEDAVEETGIALNPFALDYKEGKELSLDNPKRTLHAWFDREGYDLVYDVKEKNPGHFICTITLPVDGPNGQHLIAEVDGKGKKKELMWQCALKACQMLDQYGVLRKSNQESHKKKAKNWEDQDYYSSDDDTFLDRTGSIEQKRRLRMKQAGKLNEKAETFESMVDQYNKLESEKLLLEVDIKKAEDVKKSQVESTADPLDAFMSGLKSGVVDIRSMKSKVKEIHEEQSRLIQLINIVKPSGTIFPPVKEENTLILENTRSNKDKARTQIMYGPRKGVSSLKKSIIVNDKLTTKTDIRPTIKENLDTKHGLSQFSSVTDEHPLQQQESTTTKESKEAVTKSSSSEREAIIKRKPDSDSDNEELHNEEDIQVSKRKKKKVNYRPKKEVRYEYDSNNPDYSIWIPPEDQTGDGKTKLNEKLGY